MASKAEEEIKVIREQEKFTMDSLGSLLLLVLLVFGLVATGLFTWLLIHNFANPEPQYFAATQNNQLIQENPLNVGDMPTNDLLNWVTEGMMAIFTFNFMSYPMVITSVEEYFTPEGYESYKAILRNTKIVERVVNNKLVLTASPTSTPHITKEGVFAERYLWKLKLPMIFQYRNVTTTAQENVEVTILIMRVPTTESPHGIKIRKIDLELKGAV